jgi:hypothetical protein
MKFRVSHKRLKDKEQLLKHGLHKRLQVTAHVWQRSYTCGYVKNSYSEIVHACVTVVSPWCSFVLVQSLIIKSNSNLLNQLQIYILISFTNFNAQFLYSLTICMLHNNPQHVSSINMPISRRTNCTITASCIVALCKRLYSMPVLYREWRYQILW